MWSHETELDNLQVKPNIWNKNSLLKGLEAEAVLWISGYNCHDLLLVAWNK